MKAVFQKAPSQERSYQQIFGGLDRRPRIDETMFRDMMNLTSDNYPVLSTRPARGVWCLKGDEAAIPGMLVFGYSDLLDAANVNNGIVMCTGTRLHAGGRFTDISLPNTARRRISPFGKDFFIAPDGMLVTESGGAYSAKYAGASFSGTTVGLALSDKDGAQLAPDTVSATAPASPENGHNWIDTSATPNVMRRYSSTADCWLAVDSFVSILNTGIGADFAQGDYIDISGCEITSGEDVNGSKLIVHCESNKITVPGIISAAAGTSNASAVAIERRMPVLDYVIEHNNRLWGCRYGENDKGEFVNEIYCCKLGDALNWYCYAGISTDSYAVSLGCPGEFTGVGKVGSSVVFFKEDYIIKIWGSEPSEYQVLTTFAKGVQAGSDRSCVTVNGVLYYKCCGGIMAYDGTLPVLVSEALGDDIYSDARAGAVAGKYYVAMTDADGTHYLYVYDTSNGMWFREDSGGNLRMFVYSRNCLYMFRKLFSAENSLAPKIYLISISNIDSPGKYTNIFMDDEKDEDDYTYLEGQGTEWYAETGEIGLSSPDNKILRSLQLRVKLGAVSCIRVSVMLNSDGEWHELYKSPANAVGSFTISTPFPACDTYRLRLSGEGKCTVYSITKVTETARGAKTI